jgi:carboxylesterase type B
VNQEQAANALHVLAPGPDGARRYRDTFPAASPDELYELVHSDWLFRMPSLHLAEAQTAARGRAHVYELGLVGPPGLGGALGACHGLDVPRVFGSLDRGQPAMLIAEAHSPEAEALSARMRAAWASFAAHGDPAGPRTTPINASFSVGALRRVWGLSHLGCAPSCRCGCSNFMTSCFRSDHPPRVEARPLSCIAEGCECQA